MCGTFKATNERRRIWGREVPARPGTGLASSPDRVPGAAWELHGTSSASCSDMHRRMTDAQLTQRTKKLQPVHKQQTMNATKPGQGRARWVTVWPVLPGLWWAVDQNGISDGSTSSGAAAGAFALLLRPFGRAVGAACAVSSLAVSRPPNICIWSAMISVV